MNLAGNAVKFTSIGGVTLRARAEDDTVNIDVEDTGIGIAAEHRERIFEEFWQAERPLTRVYGGTGLGLAVSRKLARLLGGDLGVSSEMGKGSTFRLTLPLMAPPPASAPDLRHGAHADGVAAD